MKVIKYVMLAVLYLLSSTLFAYNRNQALRYAERWWNYRNVWKYEQGNDLNYPFSDYGCVDCSNFVSQCLIAGGFNLHKTGIVDDNHAIVNCNYLHDYLTGLSSTTYERIEYVNGSEEAPPWMGAGDVIIFGGKGGFQGDDWQHAVFVVSGSGNKLYCAAHSENHEDAPWKETWWGTGSNEFTTATFYHISDWEGAVADLQPFQPDGWSGSLVVSNDPVAGAGFQLSGKTFLQYRS